MSRTEKSMNNARKATTNKEKHRKNNAKAKKNKKNHRQTEGNARKFLKTMENWWNALENHTELWKMEEKRWKTSKNNWKIDENCWKNNEKARNPTPKKKMQKKCQLNSAPLDFTHITHWKIQVSMYLVTLSRGSGEAPKLTWRNPPWGELGICILNVYYYIINIILHIINL